MTIIFYNKLNLGMIIIFVNTLLGSVLNILSRNSSSTFISEVCLSFSLQALE